MNRWILLVLMQIPLFAGAQERLQFIGERIDFELNDSLFITNGIYQFVNTTNHEIRQTIIFPFSPLSDSIVVKRVFDLSHLRSIPHQLTQNGIVFKIRLLPQDTLSINIAYSQLRERENIYILKSTQSWHQALKSAKYSLMFDTSIRIDSISYPPDRKVDNVYFWDKTDFYPEENFIVWIRLGSVE